MKNGKIKIVKSKRDLRGLVVDWRSAREKRTPKKRDMVRNLAMLTNVQLWGGGKPKKVE